MVYGSLLTPVQKQPYMLAQERDLNDEVDPDSWASRLQISYKDVLNISLIETSLKVMTGWYLVPTRLAMIYATISAECF